MLIHLLELYQCLNVIFMKKILKLGKNLFINQLKIFYLTSFPSFIYILLQREIRKIKYHPSNFENCLNKLSKLNSIIFNKI